MYKVEIFIRSLFFNILFFITLAASVTIFFPVSFLPQKYVLRYWRYLAHVLNMITKYVAGIKCEIHGLDRIQNKNVIFAVRHESTWETMFMSVVLESPIFVVKKELSDIPIFGIFMDRMGMISVDREDSISSIRGMSKKAQNVIKSGHPLVIFPEGTRISPNQDVQVKKGIVFLYKSVKEKVIPVALDSGDLWPRRGFLKYPGTVHLHFLNPIEPGLSTEDFLNKLETSISEKVKELHASSNRVHSKRMFHVAFRKSEMQNRD